jgi:adenylate kinase family enzyme
MKRLIGVIGLPCSGKSYAAQLITNKVGCHYISTGSIARALTEMHKLQWEETEKNDLFPLENLLRKVLIERIESAVQNSPHSIILVDGFPRFGDQAEFMVDTFWHLHPIVIEISAGDMRTLYLRARARGRDIRDTDEFEFSRRLTIASKNMSDAYNVLSRRLVPYYTIMSGNDDYILSSFQKIVGTK